MALCEGSAATMSLRRSHTEMKGGICHVFPFKLFLWFLKKRVHPGSRKLASSPAAWKVPLMVKKGTDTILISASTWTSGYYFLRGTLQRGKCARWLFFFSLGVRWEDEYCSHGFALRMELELHWKAPNRGKWLTWLTPKFKRLPFEMKSHNIRTSSRRKQRKTIVQVFYSLYAVVLHKSTVGNKIFIKNW